MTIFHVLERITADYAEDAEGYYSSLAEAQQAILARVAEEYTPEEMQRFHFTAHGYEYETEETPYIAGCIYTITEHELNEPLV